MIALLCALLSGPPQIDVAEYRRRFAGDDPHNQEYFDESIEGLIKDAFYQAPK